MFEKTQIFLFAAAAFGAAAIAGLPAKNASRCTPPESVTIFPAWFTSEMEV